MYMLDTNICIYIKKNKPPCVLEKLKSLNANEVCMSSITYAELFYGAMKSQYPIKKIEQIMALKNPFPFYSLTRLPQKNMAKFVLIWKNKAYRLAQMTF